MELFLKLPSSDFCVLCDRCFSLTHPAPCVVKFQTQDKWLKSLFTYKADLASKYLRSEHPSAPTCYPVSYPQLFSPGLPFPQRPLLNNQDLLFAHPFLYLWPLFTMPLAYPLSLFLSPFPSPSPHVAQFSLVMSNLNPHRYLSYLTILSSTISRGSPVLSSSFTPTPTRHTQTLSSDKMLLNDETYSLLCGAHL